MWFMQNYLCDIFQYYPLKIDKSKDRLRSKTFLSRGKPIEERLTDIVYQISILKGKLTTIHEQSFSVHSNRFNSIIAPENWVHSALSSLVCQCVCSDF